MCPRATAEEGRKAGAHNPGLVPSIGSVLNFSPRAPGPARTRALLCSDSQRASLLAHRPKVTKYFSTSQTVPSTPPPCTQLLVSWEGFCRAPGRPGEQAGALRAGEDARENRWVPGCQGPVAASRGAGGSSGHLPGTKGCCLQESGHTFLRPSQHTEGLFYSFKIRTIPKLPSAWTAPKSGHPLPSPSLTPFLVYKKKCPTQFQKSLEAKGSSLPLCPTPQNWRLRG